MSSSQSASSTDGDVARDRRDIRNALFKSLRPLPLMHNWVFWYDRYIPSADSNGYNDHLSEIAQFNTDFWRIYNNLPLSITMRDSIHMFKKGIKPRWEDPRNKHGGAWTFRISSEKSGDFFIHVILLLIGETLTETLSDDDDICGVSLSARFTSNLVTIWNTTAPGSLPTSASTPPSGRLPFDLNSTNAEDDGVILENGAERVKDAILAGLSKDLVPQSWYYRIHSSHRDFKSAAKDK